MNRTALKLAVSPLVIALAMTGCSTAGEMAARPSSYSAKEQRAHLSASKSYEAAQAAVQAGDMKAALGHAEDAVAKAPRDAGYRMLLGDLYLKEGRFLSAETAFGDVLTLDPGNSRAMLNLALAEIALGKNVSALVRLDRLAEVEAPGDVGLAFALAGQADRAVALLESAARAETATGRVRQNLALAYALAGNWQQARVTAAQDLSPADLPARMQQWASFAQPQSSFDQVAGLLGVTPADDAGQPVRLALAPVTPEPVAVAMAVEPEPVPVAAETVSLPEAAPIVVAELPEAAVEQAGYVEAAATLVTPAPQMAAAPAPVVVKPTFAAAKAPFRPKPAAKASSKYIVQLGAYSSTANVDRAWAQAQKRYGFGSGLSPLRATVSLPGKGTIHRLSVSGFADRGEATNRCQSIKAKGGACFVRTVSGDAPIRIAAR